MKRMMFTAIAAGLAAAVQVQAKVTLAPVFGDNMVLQRELPVAVWGTADPQEDVTVAFAGQGVKAKADDKGAWKLRLQPLTASKENRTLTATGKDNTVTVNNVLVGEVWLCSGQSNMEMPLWGGAPQFRDKNGALLASLANYPFIRFSRMANYDFSVTPRTDYPMTWQALRPDNAAPLSAVSFYYGVELYRALDIPIGLVTSHWGGTRIEPWTPPCGFESIPSLKGIVDGLPNLKPKTEGEKNQHQQPTVLYNRMLYPFVPYTFRGAIWYQGCSNLGDGAVYGDKMQALLNGWKTVFENPGLKFYFAQLAPFTYGGDGLALPVLWETQQKFADGEKDAGMAVINDVGDLRDIHPRDKETVGRRLAVLALNRDYGFKDVIADSPTLKSHTVENGKFVLSFDHVKQFHTPGNKIPAKHFEVAGEDGKFVPAVCELKGDRLIVGAEGVAEPKQLHYLWHQTNEGNLYNEGCLPLGAFRIQ
ncbi:MAG: sialate O-acetylesterase [Verrucomicrobiota bacterium]|jgi:sialate O-acetylesterase|nr:sialate O-acetylesterase [Verrucomicrobiota bacterium]